MTTQVLWNASPYGYQVAVMRNRRMLDYYTAGNCMFDSQVYLDPDEPGAEPEEDIRKYAQQTAAEFAKEHGTKYIVEDPCLDSL